MIHGFATPLTGWPDLLCEGLVARGFRVVRFDNRDIGRSTFLTQFGAPDLAAMMAELEAGRTPVAPYSLDDMAADAAALLDALGISRAHVVGASMGGMIAQLVAINHPARTKSLVSIMSTTGRPGLPRERPEAMQALMALPSSPGREDRLATAIAAVKAIGGPGFPASDVERRAYLGRSIDHMPFGPAAARQMAAIIAAPPRNDRLKTLKIPALVIHGAAIRSSRRRMARTRRRASRGRASACAGPGHFTESAAALYFESIGDFVAKVEARSARGVAAIQIPVEASEERGSVRAASSSTPRIADR